MDPITKRISPAVAALAAFVVVATGCGGDGGTPTEIDDGITGVQVNAPGTALISASTMQLTAQVTPASAPQSVTWTSNDDRVLRVDASGLVTAAGAGTAAISAASTVDPTKSGSVQITVSCAPLEQPDIASGGNLPAYTCWLAEGPLSVNSGTLAVGEGVEIRFGTNGRLTIQSGASFNAVGTGVAPITLTSAAAGDHWRGINFDGSRSTSNVLRYVTIKNGGSTGWSGADYSRSAVLLQDNALVDIRNSTITGSGGQGITAYGGTELTFENNTLSDNAVAAWMHPDNVAAIGASNTITGNAVNVVRVAFSNTNAVTSPATWEDLGVPYEIQHRFFVEAPLMIESGATLDFLQNRSLVIEEQGALQLGSAGGEPAVLRGAEDVNAYWKGIQIDSGDAARNHFHNVRIANAGSSAWFGGANAVGSLYIANGGYLNLHDVTIEKTGGLGVIASGTIHCHGVVQTGGAGIDVRSSGATVGTCE